MAAGEDLCVFSSAPPDTRRSFVDRLADELFADEQKFVPASRVVGYRNKITYTLHPTFEISELGQPEVNALASWVASWVGEQSGMPRGFYNELTVKLSRRGQLQLKLAIIPTATATVHAWSTTDQPLLVTEAVAAFPQLCSISYHVSAEGRQLARITKPTKADDYYSAYGNSRIEEETPTPPGLRYWVSPDTFSEINHAMEDAVFATTADWLRCARQQLSVPEEGLLLVMGRDINGQAPGLALLTGPWCEIHAQTHCPLVKKDFEYNRCTTHAAAGVHISLHHSAKAKCAQVVTKLLRTRAASDPRGILRSLDMVVSVTAGRHGLHPSTIWALAGNPDGNEDTGNCHTVVYNSCNPASLRKDLELFLAAGFCVAKFKSFDFFPGTAYVTSLTAFVRRPRTLLLPVGPAGVGKTTLGVLICLNLLEQAPGGEVDGSFRIFCRDRCFAALRDHTVASSGGMGSRNWGRKADISAPRAVDSCNVATPSPLTSLISGMLQPEWPAGSAALLETMVGILLQRPLKLPAALALLSQVAPEQRSMVAKPASLFFKQFGGVLTVLPLPKGGQHQLALTKAAAAAASASARAEDEVLAAQARSTAVSTAAWSSSECCIHMDQSQKGVPLKAALAQTHRALEEFIGTSGVQCNLENGVAGQANTSLRSEPILYVDSTNGNIDARRRYRELCKAGRTIEILMRLKGTEDSLTWLLKRTSGRLKAATETHEMNVQIPPMHPSFPTTSEGQIEKHRRILLGIDWGDSAMIGNGDPGSSTERFEVNVMDSEQAKDLAWRVWRMIFAQGVL